MKLDKRACRHAANAPLNISLNAGVLYTDRVKYLVTAAVKLLGGHRVEFHVFSLTASAVPVTQSSSIQIAYKTASHPSQPCRAAHSPNAPTLASFSTVFTCMILNSFSHKTSVI